MDGCPSGLGLAVEDKPTEFSWHTVAVDMHSNTYCMYFQFSSVFIEAMHTYRLYIRS